MVNHIYGILDLLEKVKRPHVFIKELNLYIDYLQEELKTHLKDLNDKKRKHLNGFKAQLQEGIDYYKQLFEKWPDQASDLLQTFYNELNVSENKLKETLI